MKIKGALSRLKSFGTAQNRKVYARHGFGENTFGVSYANQKLLQKEIKVDHELCKGLWASGNLDARVLAMFIADPARLTSADLQGWVREADNYGLSDAIAGVAARTGSSKRFREVPSAFRPRKFQTFSRSPECVSSPEVPNVFVKSRVRFVPGSSKRFREVPSAFRPREFQTLSFSPEYESNSELADVITV